MRHLSSARRCGFDRPAPRRRPRRPPDLQGRQRPPLSVRSHRPPPPGQCLLLQPLPSPIADLKAFPECPVPRRCSRPQGGQGGGSATSTRLGAVCSVESGCRLLRAAQRLPMITRALGLPIVLGCAHPISGAAFRRPSCRFPMFLRVREGLQRNTVPEAASTHLRDFSALLPGCCPFVSGLSHAQLFPAVRCCFCCVPPHHRLPPPAPQRCCCPMYAALPDASCFGFDGPWGRVVAGWGPLCGAQAAPPCLGPP